MIKKLDFRTNESFNGYYFSCKFYLFFLFKKNQLNKIIIKDNIIPIKTKIALAIFTIF